MAEPKAPPRKPGWLEKLEQESYQAELIISGIAIFGALQLPDLIKKLIIWSLGTFSQDFMSIGYLLFVYLILASQLLIVNFVLHFLLRTLWIGNVGLASVYPNGINTESEKFSRDYAEKLKRKFPDFGAFNKQLDDFCSVIFSVASLFTMIFVSVSLGIAVLMLVSYLIALPFEGLEFQLVLFALGGLLMGLFLLQSFLGLPQLREREWVKRIHFPWNMAASKVLYGPFFRPVTYITYIFMTNSKGYGLLGLSMVYLFVIASASLPMIEDSRVLFTNVDYQEKIRVTDTRMRYLAYDDRRPEGEYIPFASIPSEVVRGTVLPVFVNLLPDPKAVVRENCDRSGLETPWEKSAAFVDCLADYYHFYIGERLVEPSGRYTYEWEDNKQYGLRAYLPMDSIPVGGQVLRIVFDGPGVDSTLRHEIRLPFQFYPEEALQ